GSGSAYTQVLSSTAVSELLAAIGMFGGSTTALGGFGSSVSANGGFTTVLTNLLTNVTFTGTQNAFSQSLDSGSASVLQAALASFGNSTGNLGGFGGSVGVSG